MYMSQAFYRSFWSSGEKRSYHLKKRKEGTGGKGQKGLVFVVAEEFTRDRVGKVCSPNCSQWQSRLGHIYATVIKWKRQSRRCPVSQNCRFHRHQESASIDRRRAQHPLSGQETSVQRSGKDTQMVVVRLSTLPVGPEFHHWKGSWSSPACGMPLTDRAHLLCHDLCQSPACLQGWLLESHLHSKYWVLRLLPD